jgi:type II secretory pathway pseudopilin PulG
MLSRAHFVKNSSIRSKLEKTHSPHAAFTLIELLVACTVAILMISLLISLLSSATSVSHRAGSSLQSSSLASALLDVLEADFRSIHVLSRTNQWINIPTVATNFGGGSIVTNSTIYMIARSSDPSYSNGAVNAASIGIPRAIRYVLRAQALATNESARVGLFRSVWGASAGQTPESTFTNFLNQTNLVAVWIQNAPDPDSGDVFSDAVLAMRVALVCRQSNGTITNILASNSITAAGNQFLVDDVSPAGTPVGFNIDMEILPAQIMSRISQASAAEFSAQRQRGSRQYSRFIPLK